MDELYYLWKTLMEEDADSVTEGGTWGSATLDSLFGCPTVDNVVAQDDDVIPGKKATESPPWKWRDGKEVRQPRLNTPVSLELSTENADTSEGRRTTNAEVMRSPVRPTKESKPKIYRSMDSSVSLAPDVEKRSRNNHGGGRPSSRPRSSFQTAEEEHKGHYARPMGHSSYAYPDYTKESSTSLLPRQKTEVRSSSVRDVHLRSNNDYYMLSRKSNSQINRRAGSMPISSIQRRPAPHGGKNCMHTRSNSQINHRGASVGMPRSSTRGIPAPLVGGYRYVIESRDPRPTYYAIPKIDAQVNPDMNCLRNSPSNREPDPPQVERLQQDHVRTKKQDTSLPKKADMSCVPNKDLL
eukprot:CAMPEP_0202491386 /NCGR_PEP_ID=MMETSP1361-20130828/8468_1 /ASSEMBLY_ACC=CAM_ASM_000849 /TAXON_ID=210615 /ORGANISM="Staurosira complex sp., Strain CCMP2646" /LENGTH=352 /DNA_ID=CAMNT_0049121425 /DNA_START=528 /DNA_END=1587 /DNA_ORIENTATION=-